jgi:hypothetical protein
MTDAVEKVANDPGAPFHLGILACAFVSSFPLWRD